jgi:hypothetical protein
MTRRRALALLALTVAVARTRRATAAEWLEPLESDSEQIFRLSWQLNERYRKPHLLGKIENVSFYGASSIQLLVEQLDAASRVVAQQVVWVGYKLDPGSSAWFDVPVPDRSATYRVRVYAFTRKFGTAGS